MIKWIVDKRHVGTHGSCVRARRMKYKCTIIRSGRTDRASLHASCQQIILIKGLIIKVKVQCSNFKVKVPTCAQTINLFARLRVNCQPNSFSLNFYRATFCLRTNTNLSNTKLMGTAISITRTGESHLPAPNQRKRLNNPISKR